MNNMNQNLCVFGDFKSRSWKLHVRIRIVLGPQNLYGEALVGPGTESRSAYLQIGTWDVHICGVLDSYRDLNPDPRSFMVGFGFYWDINPDPRIFMIGFGFIGAQSRSQNRHVMLGFWKYLVCMKSLLVGWWTESRPPYLHIGTWNVLLGTSIQIPESSW